MILVASFMATAFAAAPVHNQTFAPMMKFPEPDPGAREPGVREPVALLGCGVGDCVAALDALTAVGALAWSIVSAGSAGTTDSGKFLSAVPGGDMSKVGGWKGHLEKFDMMKNFQKGYLWWTNNAGADLCGLQTSLLREYGGNVDGKGQYLANVKLQVDYADDIWVSTLNARVDFSEPLYAGSPYKLEDHVARTTLTLHAECSTFLQEMSARCKWDIYGNGVITYRGCDMQGPH